tara:strand:+ start:968 stop:1807 length:840 start_codon:yes stop_codon:yes gene_type:complete
MSSTKADDNGEGNGSKVITVSRETVKRIVQDIKEVTNDSSLCQNGIYYEHNMDNFMHGDAMLIGPKDTPYEHGLFFFHFEFPSDYPFSPPTVKFHNHTKSKRVRMNPNLYENGRVCLSLLNTWAGEPWSACQSIRSVLLSLVTVLNEKPLLNEPGIKESHRDFSNYQRLVRFFSLKDYLVESYVRWCSGTSHEQEKLFDGPMREHFGRMRDADLLERLLTEYLEAEHSTTSKSKIKDNNMDVLVVGMYGMRATIHWEYVLNTYVELCKTHEKPSLISKT